MTNVVALPGVTIQEPPPPGEPDPELIAMVEGLLVRVKSGELTSMAWCAVHHSGHTLTNDWFVVNEQAHQFAAAVNDLVFQTMHDRAAATVVIEQDDTPEGGVTS